MILHPDHIVILAIHRQVTDWLTSVGLELHPTKTRIVHSLYEYDGHRPGFDFLGFSVRQHSVGKTHAGTRSGRPHDRLEFKTRVTPSKEAK